MKILVTGGTGFVGFHTAAVLAKHGHEIPIPLRAVRRQAEGSTGHGIGGQTAGVGPESPTSGWHGEGGRNGVRALCHPLDGAKAQTGFASWIPDYRSP